MKKYFRCILAIVLSICTFATFCAVPATVSAESDSLKFRNDHKFKIVIFSDVQDQFPVHQRVINIMKQAIARENPDLIVYLGDITEQNIKDPEVDYRRTVEQIFSPAVEAGIPYAVVFGNHDDQSYYSGTRTDKAAMLSVIQSLGDCRTVDADPELFGTGTCKIPIYSSDGSSVAFDLFMVDSNTYQTPTDGGSGYDNPHADQLAWLAANKDPGVNSFVFQHIPMPETFNLFKEDANGSRSYGGKKYALALNENATGSAGEFPHPCPAEKNTGEFAALKNMGGVLNVFTGHDHLNDFTGTYDGITMTAVPGMTYFNYGKEEVRGYGVIELNESDTANYDYHSVKFSTLDAEAGGTQETTYADYDIVTYADLRKNGNPLPETDYNIHGSNTFTYEGTSPTHSAIFKFRWTAGTDNVGFQFSFDEGENGNIAYPFGVWIKKPNQGSAGSYGAWHLRPNQADCLVNMSKAVKQGDVYNIELGKLKILTGEPQHVGEYYLYLKVNGVLIQEAYSNSSEDGQFMSGNALCQMENKIRFGDWSSTDDNNRISAYDYEAYAPYDVITYENLLDTGNNPLAEEGTTLTAQNNLFHYNATSPSHSAIYKLRWIAGNDIYFQLHPGKYGSSNNFAYRINGTNFNQRNPDANVAIGYAINEGDKLDIEIGRLLVTEGDNAGKYYTYFKVGKKVIFEKYVSADDANTTAYLDDSIQLNLRDSDHFCKIGPIIAEVEEEPEDALYYKYDEIEYGDLLLNGNYLGNETSMSGGKTFTYNKTSSTGSVILKYRWTAVEGTKFQMSFDTGLNGEGNPAVNYMFGAQLYTPGSEGHENSSLRLRPGLDDKNAWVDLEENIVDGKSYDIEFARLKVKNGDNAGKYYVYFKMDGKLISESYVNEGVVDSGGNYTSNPNSAACHISNEIYMTFWGASGNKISATPFEETYCDYDEVTYSDLLLNNKPLTEARIDLGSKREFTYNVTSETYSVILTYRWTAGNPSADNKPFYVFYFDAWAASGYPFSLAVKSPGYSALGAAAGENGAWHIDPSQKANIVQMSEPIVIGNDYDIEYGRLKVKTGPNKNKYYVYLKVNGELISYYYYAGVNDDGTYGNGGTLSENILFTSSSAENYISATPIEETYETYDEIYYSDLLKSGKALPVGGSKLSGGNIFTYNRTSPTGSAILRYRWTVGSVAKFQLSFEKTASNAMAYMFGAWLSEAGAENGFPNGRMWLRPGYGPQVGFDKPIESGSDHDIEFARLKVASGPHKGKYYVYIKIDGVLIAEDYVAAGIVDENLGYYSKPNEVSCNMTSNEIFLAFWGTEDNYISAIPFEETYETYDEIYYADLMKGGKPLEAGGSKLSGGTSFTYNRTSPTGSAILRYRWTVGSLAKFQLSFEKTKDKNSSNAISYMFGAWLSEPGAESGFPSGRMLLRPGYGSGVAIENVLESGSDHDVEFARLKVKNGPNKGKYYVYIKIDNAMIAEDYVAAGIVDENLNYYTKPNEDLQCSMTSNEIFLAFWGSENNYISAIPFEETYEDYDEIGYADLYKEGNPLSADKTRLNGSNVFTYNRTSPTGSAIFKYNWTIGTVPKFQMSFEKTASNAMAYMFGIWLAEPGADDGYDNGRMWLRPGYGPKTGFENALVAGSSHNIEFARLKVANGPNKGKYYLYIKIDDEMLSEDYVAASIVDESLNYYSKPNDVLCSMTSNEIFFGFWGSENNSISEYREAGVNPHDGTRGDLDGNGVINTKDFDATVRVLFGTEDISGKPQGIADFNNDSVEDICDIIAVKKQLAPTNTYTRSGDLVLGTQEHLLEKNGSGFTDNTKTAAYIADASATLGAGIYRLSMPPGMMYKAKNEQNELRIYNYTNLNNLKAQVAALKAKGINDILLVADSFILPYGYEDSTIRHGITVPDPKTEPEEYQAWLNINALSFATIAREVPEIKYFEPFNEINLSTTRLEKSGSAWNSSAEVQAAHKYTVQEKAGIMADLCWYISKAVKAVDPANQVTTPSICIGSHAYTIEGSFLNAFYTAIESGNYPAGQSLADKRIDNYFTIMNIHNYPEYVEDSTQQTKVNNAANEINSAYAVMQAHKDGGARVWLTETGASSVHGNDTNRDLVAGANLINMYLNKINTNLTFIDTVIIYKIADISSDNGMQGSERGFGLFYSGDDLDYAYEPKPIAKTVYSFFHGGSTDYSALDALVARYAG